MNVIGSMAYVIAWIYACADPRDVIELRLGILFSFMPSIFILLCFGMSYLPHARRSGFTPLEYLDGLIRCFGFRERDDMTTNLPFWTFLFTLFSLLMYMMWKLRVLCTAVWDLFELPDEAYQVATFANHFPHII